MAQGKGKMYAARGYATADSEDEGESAEDVGADFVRRVRAALLQLRDNGEIAKLFSSGFGSRSTPKGGRPALDVASAVSSGVHEDVVSAVRMNTRAYMDSATVIAIVDNDRFVMPSSISRPTTTFTRLPERVVAIPGLTPPTWLPGARNWPVPTEGTSQLKFAQLPRPSFPQK